jgi:hypothetical protein
MQKLTMLTMLACILNQLQCNVIVSLAFILIVLNYFLNLAELTTQCHFCNLYQQESSVVSNHTRQDYDGNNFLMKRFRAQSRWPRKQSE